MMQVKMNSCLNIPVYSLISPSNIKYIYTKLQLLRTAYARKKKKKTINNISTSGGLTQIF